MANAGRRRPDKEPAGEAFITACLRALGGQSDGQLLWRDALRCRGNEAGKREPWGKRTRFAATVPWEPFRLPCRVGATAQCLATGPGATFASRTSDGAVRLFARCFPGNEFRELPATRARSESAFQGLVVWGPGMGVRGVAGVWFGVEPSRKRFRGRLLVLGDQTGQLDEVVGGGLALLMGRLGTFPPASATESRDCLELQAVPHRRRIVRRQE